jgi:HlyD family secretion protein
MQKLSSSGDIPASRIDRTRAEANRAEATRLSAAQAVTLAQTEMDRARSDVAVARAATTNPGLKPMTDAPLVPVISPVAGRVVRVLRQSEGVVQSGEGILELGDTRALEVEVELLSSDAVKVAPGTPVRLTRWGGEVPLNARVRLIEPTGFTKISALGVEEQRVRVIADLVSPVEQWQRLGEGYRVEAAFILWSGDKVLQIPSSALFREGEKWGVFVVKDGMAHKRMLEVGHRNGLSAEILSGIAEGELVVPHPDEKLKDGLMVKTLEIKR